MPNVQYRFLPWARRGLAAEITPPKAGEPPLPGRATIRVGVTVTNAGSSGVDLSLYGPGDVLGVDPRLIVRCSPRQGATNVEPNYFAAIEFDPPDLPWMFTPARPDANQQLLPWLVLIVVDRQLVAAPKVDRLRPLPVLTIPGEVAAQELPDLGEAWAWAHTQLITDEGPPPPLAAELQARPNLNVSRLICPRRLRPNRQYMACLVPAFDAGVERGLGGTPDPKQALGPAWSATPGETKLPVYYHWEFATGPLGDFESLARKLRPFQSPSEIGRISMYVGDGAPQLPLLPPEDETATTFMDGALRAPKLSSGTLGQIPQPLQDGLAAALNAPARQLEQGPSDATPALGPPLYGQWHANKHVVDAGTPAWMRELNLDPRTRVAAGLGAEVVRKYQELFMQQCWEQVGAILQANDRLNWGRLSLEAVRHTYLRHIKPLDPDRLLQISAPLHRRTMHLSLTVQAQVRASSMPNAMVDQAMRRVTSPQRHFLKSTFRRLEGEQRLAPARRQELRGALLRSMAAGRADVDPTGFIPDGVIGTRVADAIDSGALAEVAGLKVDLALARSIRSRARPLAGVNYQRAPAQLGLRENLRATGLIVAEHVANVAALEQVRAEGQPAVNLHATLAGVVQLAVENPGAQGVLVTLNANRAPALNPVMVDGSGAVLVRTAKDKPWTSIATLEPSVIGAVNVAEVIAALPPGTLARTGALRPSVGLGAAGELLVRGSALGGGVTGVGSVITGPGLTRPVIPVGPVVTRPPVVVVPPVVVPPVVTPPVVAPSPLPPTNTIPMPLREVNALVRFERTLAEVIVAQGINTPAAEGQLQPFALAAVAKTLVARLDPAVMVPQRIQQLVRLDAGSLATAVKAELGVWALPLLDRVMAAPALPAPAYKFLAEYDQERFCPGIGKIPLNSMTLLETNPRFIEAFMVGLNYEMNRELLWREFPTDQRGTPFRHFWNWSDGKPDIEPLHLWRRGGALGANTRGAGGGGQIVLLVRGELVRRYPNAVMLAWRADAAGKALRDPPAEGDIELPVFQGKLDPDVIFAGFKLRDVDLTQGGGWFFIIQEQPTEPRFGFDVPSGQAPGALTTWRDASWAHTGVPEGGHLVLAGADARVRRTLQGLTFGKTSAHMASITLQQPMRVAVHARFLVES